MAAGLPQMMTLILLIAAFLSSIPYTVVCGIIIAIVAFAAWIKWKDSLSRRSNPLDRELSQTSHGAALILLGPLLTKIAFLEHWPNLLPPNFIPFVWPACYALMGLGGFWLVVGAMRTRTNFRDAQLIARAVIKIVFGAVLGWMLYQHILPPHDWPYRHDLYLVLLFVSLFCVLTGLVKFALLMRGPPKPSPNTNPMPHGDAAHPTRGGLG
jgi:uncharacterized membrane protein YfcA